MPARFCGSCLLIFIMILSCKSVSSKESSLPEISEESLYVKDENDQVTPSYLWSKEEREIKAIYYYLVGESYYLSSDLAKASSFFENAYNLDSSPVLGGKVLGIRSLVGDESITLLEAKKLALRYPSNAQLRFIHGTLLYKTSKREAAIKEIKKAISLDPSNEVFSISLASIYEQDKDYTTAKDIMVRVHKLNPSIGVSMYLSKLYFLSGEFQKAYIVMKRAYELDICPPEGILLYALILEANELYRESIDMFDQLYRMNFLDEKIIAKLVAMQASLTDLNEAYDNLDKLLSTSEGKDRPSILLQKVFILWFMERGEEADDILEKLHKAYPNQDKITYFLGMSKEKIKEPDAGIKIYNEISDSSQYKKFSVLRVIGIYLEKQEYKKVLSYINSMLKIRDLEEIYDRLYILKLTVFEELKDYSSACKQAELLVKLYPDNVDYLFYLGVYQEKNGDFSSSEQTLRQVMAKDPNYSSAYNHLGYMYAEKGIHLDEAQTMLEKALKIKPQDSYYLDSLGWIYFKKGNLSRALENLLKSDEILPGEPEVMEHIAQCYLKMGKKDLAKSYYKKVLDSEKASDKDKKRVKKLIDKIK